MSASDPNAGGGSGSDTAIASLLGRGSIYMLATAVQVSAGILVLPFLTRLLPAEEFGVVALAVVVQSILAVVGGLGLPAVASREYFKGTDGPARARALLRRCLVAAIAVAVLAELTGPHWSELFGGVSYDTSLRLAVWSAVAMTMVACSQSILRAQDRAGRFVVTAAGSTAVAQALGLLMVAAGEPTAAWYLTGLAIGLTATAALAAGWAGIATRGEAAAPGTRAALGIGIPTVFHSLAIYVLAAGDRVVVERLEGLAAVGRYQVAYQVGALGLAVIFAFNNAWDPIVFSEAAERRWRTLADTRAVLYRIAGMLIAALALAAPIALAVAAPSDYDPSDLAGVTAVVAFSALPMVSYMASYHVLLWEGKTRAMALTTPLAAAANIVLALILLDAVGLEGAALATVASYSLLAALTGLAARRHVRVPGGPAALLTAALGAGAVVAVSLLIPAEGLWLIPRGLAALAIGVLILRYGMRLVRRGS